MQVYIAGPFFNPVQLERIRKIETMFEVNRIRFFSPRLEAPILQSLTKEQRMAMAHDVFQSNVSGIDCCDVLFANVDEMDAGTIWEMGYAYKRKPIVTWSIDNAKTNVMLSQSTETHLHGYDSIVSFWQNANLLDGGIWQKNFWEAIENSGMYKMETVQ